MGEGRLETGRKAGEGGRRADDAVSTLKSAASRLASDGRWTDSRTAELLDLAEEQVSQWLTSQTWPKS